MSRVITFSRTFPSYHPRKGEPTTFVEQLCNSFIRLNHTINDIDELCLDWIGLDENVTGIKDHTIRAGHRFKPGDWFSPRVWSGKPYRSKQIIIAPDIQVKKTYDVIFMKGDSNYFFEIYNSKDLYVGEGMQLIIYSNGSFEAGDKLLSIAKNDGLIIEDFVNWFNLKPYKKFFGQIICWNENIEY